MFTVSRSPKNYSNGTPGQVKTTRSSIKQSDYCDIMLITNGYSHAQGSQMEAELSELLKLSGARFSIKLMNNHELLQIALNDPRLNSKFTENVVMQIAYSNIESANLIKSSSHPCLNNQNIQDALNAYIEYQAKIGPYAGQAAIAKP